MMNKLQEMLNRRDSIGADISVLQASIEERMKALMEDLRCENKAIDEEVAKLISSNPEKAFFDPEFIKTVHPLVYTGGSASSLKLREAVPSNLALVGFGGWRDVTVMADGVKSTVTVYCPRVSVKEDDSDEKLELTAEWVQRWVNTVQSALVSENPFKVFVTDSSLGERGMLFIVEENGEWVLKIEKRSVSYVQATAETLSQLLKIMRKKFHS